MSKQESLSHTIREIGFPMVIAITALVLALSSGIVNYRQNNLTEIESGLRDTRDQLQLAKNDIADMKARTLQQLVEAELTIRNRDKLLDEKDELIDQLSEANIRIKGLEQQVKDLDRALEKQKAINKKRSKNSTKKAPEAAKKKEKSSVKKATSSPAKESVTTTSTSKGAALSNHENKTTDNAQKSAETKASPKSKAVPRVEKTATPVTQKDSEVASSPEKTAPKKPSSTLADLDIFTKNISSSLQKSIGETLSKSGFKAKFPEKRKAMKMTNETTVFYYDKSYKPVAERLVKELSDITKGSVILRKGASPFSHDKIIAHIIAD